MLPHIRTGRPDCVRNRLTLFTMVSTRQPRGLLPTILTLIVLLQGVLANHGHQHVHRLKLEQIQERENTLQKRSNIAITGIQGSVYPRQEIRTLAQNADQWNLYLLGMQAFQAVPQSDPLSYYQIAGLSPFTGEPVLLQQTLI